MERLYNEASADWAKFSYMRMSNAIGLFKDELYKSIPAPKAL
jgi:hypothetical protein